jgi:hypothetical protein
MKTTPGFKPYKTVKLGELVASRQRTSELDF